MNLDDDTIDELPAPPRKEISAADLELLTLAARALSARFEEVEGEGHGNLHFEDGSTVHAWNPLQFGGDALELLATLQMQIDYDARGHRITGDVTARCGPNIHVLEPKAGDVQAATRRAVTRAAADLGKQRS